MATTPPIPTDVPIDPPLPTPTDPLPPTPMDPTLPSDMPLPGTQPSPQ